MPNDKRCSSSCPSLMQGDARTIVPVHGTAPTSASDVLHHSLYLPSIIADWEGTRGTGKGLPDICHPHKQHRRSYLATAVQTQVRMLLFLAMGRFCLLDSKVKARDALQATARMLVNYTVSHAEAVLPQSISDALQHQLLEESWNSFARVGGAAVDSSTKEWDVAEGAPLAKLEERHLQVLGKKTEARFSGIGAERRGKGGAKGGPKKQGRWDWRDHVPLPVNTGNKGGMKKKQEQKQREEIKAEAGGSNKT